jgi:deoxyadenosine/deoxycytidine kinase
MKKAKIKKLGFIIKMNKQLKNMSLFILDGIIGSDILLLVKRLNEDTHGYEIVIYEDWITHHASCADHHDRPDGIIYLRVSPEVSYARIKKRNLETESSITLDYIRQVYAEKEQLFIKNKNGPKKLEYLPMLVLNGNIDFQTDFAHYYNHLFYIRRFIQEIEKKNQITLGTYKEKTHRNCC